MKKRFVKLFIIGTIALLLDNITYGQIYLSGSVSDALTHQPISGVSIKAGTNAKTTTDISGKFKLNNLKTDTVYLTFTHISYKSKNLKIVVAPNIPIDIILEPAVYSMDEVVVTATRTHNRMIDAPGRVNLINSKQLQSIPAQNIDQYLQYVPGINYNRSFGIFSAKATITMRGLNGNEQGRVLVLLDGIPLNKSDGGTVDWNLMDINSVQKIEVIKGAGSSLYGGNAMGGIINIITKQPEEKFNLNASVEYGTYNTKGAKFNAGNAQKLSNKNLMLFWRAGAFAKKSDGYVTQSEADQKANPYIVKSNMKELGSLLKGGIIWNNRNRIETTLSYYNDNRGTGEKIHQPNGNATDHDSYGIMFSYFGDYQKLRLRSSLYLLTENYKKVNESLKDDYMWYNVLSVRRDLGFSNSATFSLSQKQKITAGFELKNGSVDAFDKYFTSTDIVYNEGKIFTTGVFAQDEWLLMHDKVKLTAGLRYDISHFYDGSFRIEMPTAETKYMFNYQVPVMNDRTWAAFSPRFSAQYKWKENNRVYVQVSRGFRAAILDDLCRSGRIKGGFKMANPYLKPEFLNNYETGFDVAPLKNLNFSVSLYYSRGKDFQYYVTNGETIDMGFGARPILLRANISKVEIYGLETELRYGFTEKFSAFVNYAYTHPTIKQYVKLAQNDLIDLSGKFLTDTPLHSGAGGITFLNLIVNTSIVGRYNGRMYINDQNVQDDIVGSNRYPAYTTIDVKLWKDFLKHFRFNVNIQNLLDKKYYDSKYAVCPGRFITGQLEYRL